MEPSDSVDLRISRMGLAEVGRRYLGALRAPDDSSEKWIVDATWFGEDLDGSPLDPQLHWDLAMAALAACPDDDGDLWLLGDGPFDCLAAKPGMTERLYAARDSDANVRRLFDAMRRELPSEGVTDGWWFE